MNQGILEFSAKSSEADLEKYLPQLPSNLSESYIDFLKSHNDANGDLPVQPLWFQFWQIDQLVEANRDYKVQIYLPNYFGIGSNDAGELIAVNLESQRIFSIPFIGMKEKDAWLIAESFEDFQNLMGYTE